MPPELAIMLPACNEQASVRKVLLECFQEVENPGGRHFISLSEPCDHRRDPQNPESPSRSTRASTRDFLRVDIIRHE